MKYTLFSLVASGILVAAVPIDNVCINGAFECVDDVVFQCNLGTWVVQNDCAKQNLVCNHDFECVPREKVSLSAPARPLGACINGAFECVDNIVFQCNLGTWGVQNDCAKQNLVCNHDFECVPRESVNTTIPLSAPARPLGTCVNGDFECIDNIVFHCNLGTWIIENDCAKQNLVCNRDFECVHHDDASLSLPLTSPIGTCINGAFECVNDVVYHCNLGTWIIENDCAKQNLVCNRDFECVRHGDVSLSISIPSSPHTGACAN